LSQNRGLKKSKVEMGQIPLCFVLMLTAAVVVQGQKDPCLATSHTILNQPQRSTGYDNRPTDSPLCDNQLRRGWFRFTDANGANVQIPTTCPGMDTCGTVTPFWMVGDHPSGNDIVMRQMCGKKNRNDDPNGGCCDVDDGIFVKKCAGFFVYYLNPTSSCPSAYCAGTVKRCPMGQWSKTGFVPCRDPAPVLKTPPVVRGPNVYTNQSFNFRCYIDFAANDADQVFEVVWTFNDKPDPAIKPITLTGSQKVALLSGNNLKKHFDSNVQCQVTTSYKNQTDKKVFKSKPIPLGVQSVKLNGPFVRSNKTFNFECEVGLSTNDKLQRIEVVWTFDGKEDPAIRPKIVLGHVRKDILDGKALNGHINTNVGCQARLVFAGVDMKTNFKKSNTFFAGINVYPKPLNIKDSDGEKDITISSTIPIVCDQGTNCCLTFDISIDKESVVYLKDSCGYRLCLSDWDDVAKQAAINVTVVPSKNFIDNAVREAYIQIEKPVPTATSQYSKVFEGLSQTKLQVLVKLEAGFKCSGTGDPHFNGFDYKTAYHLYLTGDYIMYDVKNRNFQVQIRTWPCWGVTCICGVVVRENNDIVRVFGCNTARGLVKPTDVKVPNKLSKGAKVLLSANGQHVGILLSSGSEVKINIYERSMDVFIRTPAFDRNMARGICGTNDGNPGNDFTHPDGTVSPICTGHCMPNQFFQSWSVNGTNSMFEVAPAIIPEKDTNVNYCSCREEKGKVIRETCSPRQHVQTTPIVCQGCADITKSLVPATWSPPKKPYIPEVVKPVDPNKKWPNDKGVTEAQAKQMCKETIEKSPLYTKCQNLNNLVDSAMSECLGDVLIGGTTDALRVVTSSFTNKCQATLAEDVKNYVKDAAGGDNFVDEFSKNVPPIECLTHGKYGKAGKCDCDKGWEGETCQIDSGKGPQISYTTGSPLCNGGKKSCESVELNKDNVDIFKKLKCRVQPINNDGKKSGVGVVVDSGNVVPTRVSCPIPTSKLSIQRYTISVSTDGVSYGNELMVYTVDPTCQECDDDSCIEKKTACHIEDVCYKNGETNQNNKKQVCDVSKDTTSWTTDPATLTELEKLQEKLNKLFEQAQALLSKPETASGAELSKIGIAMVEVRNKITAEQLKLKKV
jgi:hypothetical protein